MNLENRITNIEELPLSLTAKDIAKVLGISLEHAYKLIHRKEFPSVQIGVVQHFKIGIKSKLKFS